MKLFIWEGDRISSAYQDDGTLVVLAESPEQAREITRAEKLAYQQMWAEYRVSSQVWHLNNTKQPDETPLEFRHRASTEIGFPILNERLWNGDDEGLDREPDRVIELNQPTVVAFNSGNDD